MALKKFTVTLAVNPDGTKTQITVEADRVGYDALGNLVFLIDRKIKVPGKADSASVKTIRQWVMFDEKPDFDA